MKNIKDKTVQQQKNEDVLFRDLFRIYLELDNGLKALEENVINV